MSIRTLCAIEKKITTKVKRFLRTHSRDIEKGYVQHHMFFKRLYRDTHKLKIICSYIYATEDIMFSACITFLTEFVAYSF